MPDFGDGERSVKVILTGDVKGVGQAGALVEVADGYARNYLIPRGLAVAATGGTLKGIQAQQQQIRRRLEKELERARALADRITSAPLVIAARAGEGGRLFGSVTAADVARAIEERYGQAVDRRRIELPSPIKSLGTYTVTARLAPGLSVDVTVVVEPEASQASA